MSFQQSGEKWCKFTYKSTKPTRRIKNETPYEASRQIDDTKNSRLFGDLDDLFALIGTQNLFEASPIHLLQAILAQALCQKI